ncbi:hypothetical protein [Streptomyces sp. NPDC001389]|uniref:hypothetical protein n=1 Tax=Streptomyces sp. NPDC001389 TaxID=3364569 RepID=UPI0036BC1121
MSRYLDPRRPMAAPPPVVRVLHAELRADPARLEKALALAEAVHAARRAPGSPAPPGSRGPAGPAGPAPGRTPSARAVG